MAFRTYRCSVSGGDVLSLAVVPRSPGVDANIRAWSPLVTASCDRDGTNGRNLSHHRHFDPVLHSPEMIDVPMGCGRQAVPHYKSTRTIEPKRPTFARLSKPRITHGGSSSCCPWRCVQNPKLSKQQPPAPARRQGLPFLHPCPQRAFGLRTCGYRNTAVTRECHRRALSSGVSFDLNGVL
jgi:hypothetical protein